MSMFGWTSSGAGATGPAGPKGIDGKSVLHGESDPLVTTGNNGDFYINTVTNYIFGPKTAGSWGSGTSLVGPRDNGLSGMTGTQLLVATGTDTATSAPTVAIDEGGNLVITSAAVAALGGAYVAGALSVIQADTSQRTDFYGPDENSHCSVDATLNLIRLGYNPNISASDMVVGTQTITEISSDPIEAVMSKVDAFVRTDNYPDWTSFEAFIPNYGGLGYGAMILENAGLTINATNVGAVTINDGDGNTVFNINTSGAEGQDLVTIQGSNAPSKLAIYNNDGVNIHNIDTLIDTTTVKNLSVTTAAALNTATVSGSLTVQNDNSANKVVVNDTDGTTAFQIDTTTNTTTIENLVINGSIIIPTAYASPLYGDGSDGDVALDGGSRSLVRDMFYRNLTIGTYTLITNGFRIFVQGVLTMNNTDSIITNDGGSTSGGSNASGAPSNTVGGGADGGISGSSVTGIGGYGGGNSISRLSAGDGWDGSTMNCFHSLPCITTGRTLSGAIALGGSGGYGYASNGGGGGVIVLCANVLSGVGSISAAGGDGLAGSGGGGGFILVATSTSFDTGSIRLNVAGGSGITNGNAGQYMVIVSGQPALLSKISSDYISVSKEETIEIPATKNEFLIMETRNEFVKPKEGPVVNETVDLIDLNTSSVESITTPKQNEKTIEKDVPEVDWDLLDDEK